MSYPLQRIANVARRQGISFLEAARLCGRKGAALRRRRRLGGQRTEDGGQSKAPAVRCWWQEGQYS